MKRYLLLVIVFLSACASSSLKDNNTTVGPIQEYDDKVVIKPLPAPTQDEKNSASAPASTATPKLGLEPLTKVEMKGKKKKKSPESPEVPEAVVTGVRQPEVEDTEGFNGRRPIVDPFHVGEKVTMMVTYFGVSAGDITLEVKPYVEVNGRKAYHFYSKLDSSSVFSMFYKIDDFANSYMDYEQLVPINFSISVKESKQLREVRQIFDWKTLKASFWERKVTQESGVEEKKKNWDLRPFSQDIYTALYYIRMFALKEGKTYIYPVSDDNKNWEVKAKVIRREILKTDLGNFKTVVIQPQVAAEGVFKPMGEVFFWYTDDERHFPVKFEAKIKIGKLVGYLKALEKGAP
ncbi:MAG: DUF3108 domain-containing protein [Oligoflexia bacterium]|nr:DUF3108 domain-containing protein [Oligoflexia bacterium]